MGQFYLRNDIDSQWFNLDEYFEIIFHYEYGEYTNPKDIDYYLDAKEFPALRKWIRDDCDGDVIIKRGSNNYHRKWIVLKFEYESDLMAFKLKWL